MTLFAQSGIAAKSRRPINRCRMFLQALTVADIATGNGRAIRRDAWSGIQDLHLNLRRYNWTRQERPSAADWRAWRDALSATLVDGPTPQGDVDPPLKTRLGNWTSQASTLWRWYLHRSGSWLYEWMGATWRLWEPASRRSTRGLRKRWLPITGRARAPQRSDLRRTTVMHRGHDRGIWTTGSCQEVINAEASEPTDLVSRMSNGDPRRTWATQCCVIDDNGTGFAAALRAGTAIAVSDGSFKDQHGTAASILQDIDGRGRLIVLNEVPGCAEDQNPYRSELSGLYGIVCTIEQTCAEHDVTQGAVTIGCDGQEALYRAVISDQLADSTYCDFDLISAIQSKIRSLPVTVTGHWVEGHQDDLLNRTLDVWAQLNVWCDALAKRHWARTAPLSGDIQWEIEGELPTLWLGARKICSKVNSSCTTGARVGGPAPIGSRNDVSLKKAYLSSTGQWWRVPQRVWGASPKSSGRLST